MGLEGVELIMSIEETFGVEFSDEEIFEAVTPRLIGDKIFLKLQKTDEKTCLTQRAFYILRRSLMQLFNLPRDSVKPDTPINDIISPKRQHLAWEQIRSMVQARSWPGLNRPILLIWILSFITIFSGVLFTISLQANFDLSLSLFIGMLMTIQIGVLSAKVTTPYRTRLPRWCKSIRDIVPYVITSDQIKWTRGQVSQVLKKTVIKQLDINESDYSEDFHFVYDFGLGS